MKIHFGYVFHSLTERRAVKQMSMEIEDLDLIRKCMDLEELGYEAHRYDLDGVGVSILMLTDGTERIVVYLDDTEMSTEDAMESALRHITIQSGPEQEP